METSKHGKMFWNATSKRAKRHKGVTSRQGAKRLRNETLKGTIQAGGKTTQLHGSRNGRNSSNIHS